MCVCVVCMHACVCRDQGGLKFTRFGHTLMPLLCVQVKSQVFLIANFKMFTCDHAIGKQL